MLKYMTNRYFNASVSNIKHPLVVGEVEAAILSLNASDSDFLTDMVTISPDLTPIYLWMPRDAPIRGCPLNAPFLYFKLLYFKTSDSNGISSEKGALNS